MLPPLSLLLLFSPLLLLVVIPLCVWVHELAHAAMVLRLTGGRAVVVVGRLPAACVISLRRLEIRWHPSLRAAFCEWDARDVTVRTARRIIMAGPLANAVQSVLFLWLTIATWAAVPFWLWVELLTTFAVSGLICAVNLRSRPVNVLGKLTSTDGHKLRALRGLPADAVLTDGLRAVLSAGAAR
ncbi:MAG TPA: site-2 protease family protein [Nitrolancea sp.]|nr:site-2 protease family protein [Nitrolancea sp.]